MVRAILFDAAGTLIETTASVGECYSRIAGEYGVELPAWRLQDAFRRVHAGMPPMCFEDEPLPKIPAKEHGWWRELVRRTILAADSTTRFADFDGYFQALWEHFAAGASWRVRPGGRETLGALRDQGVALGVVSNFDLRLTKILQELEIIEFFDCIILPGTHRLAKPDPRVFAPALAALGMNAAQCAYVGDEPEVDGVAARGAGLRFVDVTQLDSLSRLTEVLG